MPRHFLTLSYDGTDYFGWQRQPGTRTVQGMLEEALSTVLREDIELVGCGRTDAGVHARNYVAHFNATAPLPDRLLGRLNRYLPADVALHRIQPVSDQAHARFDATHRAYVYHLHTRKEPHRRHHSYHFPFADQLDRTRLEAAAALLPRFAEFAPFCKTGHDAPTLRCDVRHSEWRFFPDEHRMEYHIAADRFLRGMVRLIVGMSLHVGVGKMTRAEVEHALETQTALPKPWSVPGNGLFLREVRYDRLNLV